MWNKGADQAKEIKNDEIRIVGKEVLKQKISSKQVKGRSYVGGYVSQSFTSILIKGLQISHKKQIDLFVNPSAYGMQLQSEDTCVDTFYKITPDCVVWEYHKEKIRKVKGQFITDWTKKAIVKIEA